jgi:eukaryotic-like serine/threonine-protein kinase
MQPGTVVADRFEIEALAGEGGMGSVYRAKDRATGRTVALKLLRYEVAHAARFRREAELLSKLDHPGIVRFVAHAEPREGVPAHIAMEWLDGESLRERLKHRGELPIADAISIVVQAARALATAHAIGVVHRDVKPENLFLVGGRVDSLRVLDFGIAFARGGSQRMTRTGMPLGTIGYMAPEQVRGDPDVDARADVFALGEVLFECLTGLAAFSANHPLAVLAKIVFEEAAPVRELRPGVSQALEALLSDMLAKDRERRPKDGAAVARALEALAEPEEREGATRKRRSLTIGQSERQHVSVVVGAAEESLAEETLPVAEHNRRAESLQGSARRFGGRFELLASECFVLTFSGQAAATDTASNAARAALALGALASGLRLAVVTGSGVSDERLPVARVVDRAVELLRDAGSDEVLIDDTTRGLLPAQFQIGERNDAHLLLAERDAMKPARLLLGKNVPCFGRERELQTLSAILDECVNESVARAVVLSGPPGVGKSRIRFELVSGLALNEAKCRVWVGRGDPLKSGAPFALVGSALGRAFSLPEGDDESARRVLARRVAEHVPADAAVRVSEFIGEIVGVPFPEEGSVQLRAARQDPILMRDQIQRAWDELIEHECRIEPLLLVLEDLQWGDLPSVKLVDGALRRLPELPFMVLAVGRPELHDVHPGLWTERGVQEIRVRELGKRAAAEIVKRALGDTVDPHAIDTLVERAAGNALYLEELVRAWADGRRDAPESVIAMVKARLESMEPDARRVLRAASVFGQTIWRDAVSKLLGDVPLPVLSGWLGLLAEREVFTERKESRYPGDPELVFRHALVRDAAYDMLTEEDRTLGHRLAAEWLIARRERDASLLAEHWEKGGLPEKAVPHWIRAAESALDANDFSAARAAVARGIAAGATGQELGELRLVDAEALRWSGELGAAADLLRGALELMRRGTARWYAGAAELALLLQRAGRADELFRLARTLLAQSVRDPGSDPLAYAMVRAALFAMISGQSQIASELMNAVAHVERECGGLEPSTRAQRHVFRALQALYRSDLAEYLEQELLAKDCFEQAGDLRRALNESGSIGYAHLELGAHAEAERVLSEALGGAKRIGLDHVRAASWHNLGLVYAHLGRFAEAREAESAALETFRHQGDRRLEGAALTYLAQIQWLEGDLETAGKTAREALELVREVAPPIVPLALAVLGAIELARGDAEDALRATSGALQSVNAPGGVESGDALIRLVHAQALLALGRRDEARDALGAAKDRLLERAAQIRDPDLRQSFLDRVPENRKTLELAQSLA